jgi:dephospho-CoA kinase
VERLAAADDVIENHNGSEMAIKTRILALHETYLAIASQQGRQV